MRRRVISLISAFVFAAMPLCSVLAEELPAMEETSELWQESNSQKQPEINGNTEGILPGEENQDNAPERPDAQSEEPETAGKEFQAAEPEANGGEFQADVLGADEPEDTELISEGEITETDANDSAEDGFIVGIEEVAPEDFISGSQDIIIEETVTDSLEESGVAEYAALPAFALFSNAEYINSYGEQLDGDAEYVYKQMEQKCAELEAACAAGAEYELPVIPFTPEEVYSCHISSEEYADSSYKTQNTEYKEMVALLKYPMQAAYDAYVFDHPEAYWMGAPGIQYSLVFRANGSEGYVCVVSNMQINIKENYEGALLSIPEYESAVLDALQAIQNTLAGNNSESERVRAVHDYLCDTLTYDHAYQDYETTSREYKYIHSAAGAFLDAEHKVVCDGYAKAFKILLNKFDIPCAVIPGNAGGGHAWNYVKMEDGNWYLTDVTWDDTNNIKTDRYFLLGSQTIPDGKTAPVGESRTAYTVFSSAVYTKSFAVPQLYTASYHTEHSWTDYVHRDATCTEDSAEIAACEVAGCPITDVITDEGSRLGHAWTDYTSNGDATCTEDGTKTAICQREGCDATDTIADQGSAGHLWGSYESNGDATCTEDGTKTAICQREGCQATDTVADAGSRLGHAWTNYVSNGDATCTADGTKTAVCNRAGCAVTNTVADAGSRLGHAWTKYVSNGDATCLKDGTRTAVCDHTGCTATNTIIDTGSRLPATITLNVANIPLKVKQSTTKVKVSGLAPGDSVKSWSSNKPKVASVNAKTGKITAKKTGTARITVTLRSGKAASFTVKVQKSAVKTKKISGVAKKLTLKKKAKYRLAPVLSPVTSQQKVTYSSSSKKIAAVSKNGVITAKKAGKATITVKSGSKTVKCKVTVK